MDKKQLENTIIKALKTIYDPEIPVSIYEMGLIYDIIIDEGCNVEIIMTLTTPNCPVAESLPADAERKVNGIKEVKSAKVKITFEPPWTMDMMSEEARFELGYL